MSFLYNIASSGAWYSKIVSEFNDSFIADSRYKLYIEGVMVTVKVSLLSVLIGLIIGIIIALFNLSKSKALNVVGKWYTDIIRGTPAVTQLCIIYFIVFGCFSY